MIYKQQHGTQVWQTNSMNPSPDHAIERMFALLCQTRDILVDVAVTGKTVWELNGINGS